MTLDGSTDEVKLVIRIRITRDDHISVHIFRLCFHQVVPVDDQVLLREQAADIHQNPIRSFPLKQFVHSQNKPSLVRKGKVLEIFQQPIRFQDGIQDLLKVQVGLFVRNHGIANCQCKHQNPNEGIVQILRGDLLPSVDRSHDILPSHVILFLEHVDDIDVGGCAIPKNLKRFRQTSLDQIDAVDSEVVQVIQIRMFRIEFVHDSANLQSGDLFNSHLMDRYIRRDTGFIVNVDPMRITDRRKTHQHTIIRIGFFKRIQNILCLIGNDRITKVLRNIRSSLVTPHCIIMRHIPFQNIEIVRPKCIEIACAVHTSQILGKCPCTVHCFIVASQICTLDHKTTNDRQQIRVQRLQEMISQQPALLSFVVVIVLFQDRERPPRDIALRAVNSNQTRMNVCTSKQTQGYGRVKGKSHQ